MHSSTEYCSQRRCNTKWIVKKRNVWTRSLCGELSTCFGDNTAIIWSVMDQLVYESYALHQRKESYTERCIASQKNSFKNKNSCKKEALTNKDELEQVQSPKVHCVFQCGSRNYSRSRIINGLFSRISLPWDLRYRRCVEWIPCKHWGKNILLSMLSSWKYLQRTTLLGVI